MYAHTDELERGMIEISIPFPLTDDRWLQEREGSADDWKCLLCKLMRDIARKSPKQIGEIPLCQDHVCACNSDAGDFDRRLSSLHIFSFSLFLLAHRAHSDPEASRGIYKKIFIFVAHAQYPKSPDPHELLPNKAAESMALCVCCHGEHAVCWSMGWMSLVTCAKVAVEKGCEEYFWLCVRRAQNGLRSVHHVYLSPLCPPEKEHSAFYPRMSPVVGIFGITSVLHLYFIRARATTPEDTRRAPERRSCAYVPSELANFGNISKLTAINGAELLLEFIFRITPQTWMVLDIQGSRGLKSGATTYTMWPL